jgi:hypothetical protein
VCIDTQKIALFNNNYLCGLGILSAYNNFTESNCIFNCIIIACNEMQTNNVLLAKSTELAKDIKSTIIDHIVLFDYFNEYINDLYEIAYCNKISNIIDILLNIEKHLNYLNIPQKYNSACYAIEHNNVMVLNKIINLELHSASDLINSYIFQAIKNDYIECFYQFIHI